MAGLAALRRGEAAIRSDVSERLRRVRYGPGKGRIISLLRPSPTGWIGPRERRVVGCWRRGIRRSAKRRASPRSEVWTPVRERTAALVDGGQNPRNSGARPRVGTRVAVDLIAANRLGGGPLSMPQPPRWANAPSPALWGEVLASGRSLRNSVSLVRKGAYQHEREHRGSRPRNGGDACN